MTILADPYRTAPTESVSVRDFLDKMRDSTNASLEEKKQQLKSIEESAKSRSRKERTGDHSMSLGCREISISVERVTGDVANEIRKIFTEVDRQMAIRETIEGTTALVRAEVMNLQLDVHQVRELYQLYSSADPQNPNNTQISFIAAAWLNSMVVPVSTTSPP